MNKENKLKCAGFAAVAVLIVVCFMIFSPAAIAMYPQYIIWGTGDGDVIPIAVDDSTHGIVISEIEQKTTHEGNHYFVKTFLVDTGGTGSTSYFSFTTPDTLKMVHARAHLAPDVDTEVNIYFNATVTGGTPVVGINNNMNSVSVAGLTVLAAPTVSVAGTKFWSARTGGGKNPVGVAPGINYEIIAKRNSTYVFEIIKRTTADLVIDIDFWWYEHEAKG